MMEGPLQSSKRPAVHGEAALSIVLSRLSPADLFCCGLVSKGWFNLVCKVASIRPKFTFFSMQPRYFSFSGDGSECDVHLPPPSLLAALCSDGGCPGRMVALVGVSNGMAYCAVGYDDREYRKGDRYPLAGLIFSVAHFKILNPATGGLSTLTGPYELISDMSSDDLYLLAFDPRISSKHFKLLWLQRRDFSSDHATAYLHSSTTQKWEPLAFSGKPPPHLDICIHQRKCYCFNGVAYTLAGDYDDGSSDSGFARKTILVFNVQEERLSWIISPTFPIPGFSSKFKYSVSLGEAAGRLRFAYHVPGKLLSTWHLGNDCVWSPTHNINLEDAFVDDHHLLRPKFFSLCFHPYDLNKIFVTSYTSHLFILDLETMEVRQFTKGAEHPDLTALFAALVPFVCTPDVK